MLITRTPNRISLCGGSTDFPSHFLKFGGLVVGGAISHSVYLHVRKLPPFHTYKNRIVYSEIETNNAIGDIQHRAIRECLKYVGIEDGIEILHASDLPGKSGTGSSSSFVVGLLNALYGLKGERRSPDDLADAAIKIEQERLGEVVGCQDQIFAAHGGFNIVRFRRDGDIHVYPFLLNKSKLEALENHLLLFFTGIERISSHIAASYSPQVKQQFALMKLAEDSISAIEKEDFRKLGDVIDQSWRIKCSLSDKVANSHIHEMYAMARICGAWGGKITGAGGGGSILLVCPPEKHAQVIEGMQGKGCVPIPFNFDFQGSQVIFASRT